LAVRLPQEKLNEAERKAFMRQFSFMVLGAALLALSVPAQAQQASKVFRIGFMAGVSPPPAEPSRSNIEAFVISQSKIEKSKIQNG
jgi:hypothetical protein